MSAKQTDKLIEGLGILVVDPNPHMRRLTRMMLMNVGAKLVYEAADGLAAIDIISHASPDVMLLDWEMPVLSGPQILHMVRSPGVFSRPSLPVIMLTDQALRSQVQEALRLGVNEFLLKPTSPKALRDRLLSIVLRPRPMVQIGKYFVPEPRRPLELRQAA
jgi:two-component system, chemotaxis family, chemotaxis protein CheY